MSNYTKKAIRGAGATFLMGILAAAVSYIFRIILARSLGPEDFGLFYSVLTFIIFFLFFRDLGLGPSLVKHIAKFRVNKENDNIKTAIFSVLNFQIISSIIIGIIFFVLSEYLAINYFKNKAAEKILNLLIIYVLSSIFFIVIKGFFRGFSRMLLFSSVEFVKNLIVLILTLIFLKYNFGVISPALAYVLVTFILIIIYLPFALKIFPITKHKIVNYKTTTKKIVLFGMPLFATSFADKIIGYIDTILLTYFTTLVEVGVYNVVLPSALILMYVGSAVGATAFPIVAELWEKKDLKRLREGINLIYKYLFLIVIPPTLVIFYYSSFLISTLFGVKYSSGSNPFKILLVGVIFFSLALVNNNIISAIGKPKTVAKITFISAMINLFLNLLLISKFGMIGAAITTTISYFVSLILSTMFIKKKLGIEINIINWLKQFILGIIFILILSYFSNLITFNPWITIIISTIIATIIYIMLIFIIKIVKIDEIKQYIKLIK